MTRFAGNLYLTIVLIVPMAMVGCILPVWTKSDGAKYSIIEDGTTSKTRIVKEFGDPIARTLDGRFVLYSFHQTTVWLVVFSGGGGNFETDNRGRILIEFNNNIVKRHTLHPCEKKALDLCDASNEDAFWVMIDELLGNRATAEYRVALVGVASLAALLREAVEVGDVQQIKQLMDEGASAHVVVEGDTPWMVAVERDDKPVVELLIAKGANVNNIDTGRTALHVAARGGHVAIANLLLANGARVNMRNDNGIRPLTVAIRNGHTEIVKELLAHGAKE